MSRAVGAFAHWSGMVGPMGCDHNWKLYDVYWAEGWPNNFGNFRCTKCSERKVGERLSDKAVTFFLCERE